MRFNPQLKSRMGAHWMPRESQENNNSLDAENKVVYWAGMRVEGPLRPFEKKIDENKAWHEAFYNGGLFANMSITKGK